MSERKKSKENGGFRPQFLIPIETILDASNSSTGENSNGLKIFFNAQNIDEELSRAFKTLHTRKRGERTKLLGGITLEKVAIQMFKEHRDQLKKNGEHAGIAGEMALDKVSRLLGISPETLNDWYRGVSRREREKPLEKRIHSRRKRSKASD